MVNIHDTLYARAEQSLYENIVLCRTWEEFLQALSEKKLAICPSANTNEVEENIKQKTKKPINPNPNPNKHKDAD